MRRGGGAGGRGGVEDEEEEGSEDRRRSSPVTAAAAALDTENLTASLTASAVVEHPGGCMPTPTRGCTTVASAAAALNPDTGPSGGQSYYYCNQSIVGFEYLSPYQAGVLRSAGGKNIKLFTIIYTRSSL